MSQPEGGRATSSLGGREVQQLLQAVNRRAPFGERDHAMLALALHTGLRVSELVGLDIRHVAHDGQPRQALHLPSELGKGGRERIVQLNDVARRAVAVFLDFNRRRGFSTDTDRSLLVNPKHDRLPVRYVQRLMGDTRGRPGSTARMTSSPPAPGPPHDARSTRLACEAG